MATRAISRLSTRLLLLILVTASCVILEWRLRPPAGANAEYYAGTRPSGAVRVRTIDRDIATIHLERHWPWRDEPFSARWTGWLLVPRAGTYRFVTRSDDGSWLYVDDALVVDNGGTHEGRAAVGDRALSAGFHALTIEYFNAGGGFEMEALWAAEGETLRRLGPPELVASKPTDAQARWWPLALSARNVLVVATTVAWFAACVAFFLVAPIRAIVRRELPGGLPRRVTALLVMTCVISAAGIWWGLPGVGWGPDEVTPDDLAGAVDARFAHGWSSKYPPAHYEATLAATLPLWVAREWDPTIFDVEFGYAAAFLHGRVLSLSMSVAALLLFYLCGRRILDHRGALFAAAAIASMPTWAYYAKLSNLDVPYLFWYALAMLAYLRLRDEPRASDLYAFAAAGTLAVCTKDQAYGLFVVPAALVLWRVSRRDPRLSLASLARAGALAIAIFLVAHTVIWNAAGFVDHVRRITGQDSSNFRIYPRDPAGEWAMLRSSAMLLPAQAGAIVLALAAAGAAFAISRRDAAASRLGWLSLSAASYYVTFIAIVGYNYDRFLMPIAIVAAFFAGYGLERLLAASRGNASHALVKAVAVVALAQIGIRAILIDAGMIRDSRYYVEAWMRERVRPTATVGTIGLAEYLPRLGDFRLVDLRPLRDELSIQQPHAIVVNADFARRLAADERTADAYSDIATGSGAYRLALSYKTPLPLEAWTYDRALASVDPALSNLSKVNPLTLVFERVPK